MPKRKQMAHKPGRNMFGLLPCPKCKGEHRWPTQPIHPKHPRSILCDDCGHVEPMTKDTLKQLGIT